MTKTDPKTKQNLEINVNTVVGSQYAQIVGVSVTEAVTLDFIYVSTQVKGKGQAVARVTIPKETAIRLSSLITETIKKHNANSNI